MSRPVYSVRFIASPDPLFPPPPYVVPDGYVAIVRSIDFFAPAGNSGNYSLVQLDSPACVLFLWTFGSTEGTAHWDGRQVVEEGESISLNSSVNAPGSALVSGYLLTLD